MPSLLAGTLLEYPFFTGTSTTAGEVPSLFPVALDGRGYVVDWREYERQSVDILRQQADDSDKPSERSFNPVALWARSVETWHRGAGQVNFDLRDSDEGRFRTSKGVDPWTPGQISLLPATDAKAASANSNVRGVTAGVRYYKIDGQVLSYTEDITAGTPTFTTVTGTPAETPTSITTDGFNVWVAYPSRPYVTNTGTGAASTFGAQPVDLIAYCNGRLIAANDNTLYELDSTGTVVGTDIYEHPNTGFTWDVIASSAGALYVAGHAGTHGELYRVTVDDTTTALGAPSIAAPLPTGEYVTAVLGYVGVVVLGTSKGVRVAAPDAAGNLSYGPLIVETGAAVFCLDGEDRFVWFGWSDYDASSTGLGRLDLSVFTATLRPAFASDLMATAQGAVLSVATFQGRRVLTVAGSGTWAEDTVLEAEGTIDSGLIRWGTTERKIVVNADLRTQPLPAGATVTLSVAYDAGTFEGVSTLALTSSTGPDTVISTREQATEQAETRLTLTRATITTEGPGVLRATVKALPTPGRTERILLPILLFESVKLPNGDGQEAAYDTAVEFRFLKGLELAGSPVSYQEGLETWTVTVQRVGFKPSSMTKGNAWLNGTCYVTLETI